MAGFGENFVEGLRGGIALKESWAQGRKERSMRNAMDILSQADSYDPYAGTFDESAQAVPEGGQAVTKSNRGFDGSDFETLHDQYFDAIADIGSIDDYAKAKDAWGVMKATKVTDALDGAMAAYDRGDMEGAKKLFRGASAYISPGMTPEIEIDPRSGAVIVANYDKKGNPAGGGAFTRQQLEDLRMYYTNPETWANRKQKGEQFEATEGRLWAGLNDEISDRSARLDSAKNADQRASAQAHWDNLNAQYTAERAALDLRIATATEELAISTTQAELAARTATAIDQERQAANAKVAEASKILMDLNRFSKTQQEEIRKARGGDVDIPSAIGVLFGVESSWNPNAVSSKGAAGLGQIMESNIVPWAREQLPQFVAGMSDEQIRSLYASNEDFQAQLGTAKFTDILYGEAKGNLQDAFSIWHSGDPYAQAVARGANDIVNGKGMTTKAYVAKMMEAYNKRTGGAGTGDRRVASAEPALPTDVLGGTEEEKEPKEEQFGYAQWLYEPPNEAGEVVPRVGIEAMTTKLMEEIDKLNPDISENSLAALADGAFNPANQTTQILDPAENDGEYYLSNGVDKVQVSKEGAGLIEDYRYRAAQELIAAAPDAASRPQPQAFAPQPAVAAAIPEPALPTQEALGPGPGAGGVMTPSDIGVNPVVRGAGAAAAAAQINPYAAPAMGQAPRAIDDTAVAGAPAARQVPTGQQASVLAQVPALGQAVQAWIAAGAPPQGPEFTVLRQLVGQLPPEMQQQAMQEIIGARQQGAR